MSGQRSGDGYLICQARGCDEPATPWAIVLPVDDVEIEVLLCRRHEGALFSTQTSARRERVESS